MMKRESIERKTTRQFKKMHWRNDDKIFTAHYMLDIKPLYGINFNYKMSADGSVVIDFCGDVHGLVPPKKVKAESITVAIDKTVDIICDVYNWIEDNRKFFWELDEEIYRFTQLRINQLKINLGR